MTASHRKGGRVVECAGLEIRCTVSPYRGFESLPFRQGCGQVRKPWRLRELAAIACTTLLMGCASRSGSIPAAPMSPDEFVTWSCIRIDDDSERVQKRASDVAYAVDQRVGQNILALGVGLTVFWPALFALRPDGLEAEELAQLKGRFEALGLASARKACPPSHTSLPPERLAALPVAVGDRLVYEDRRSRRGQPAELRWEVTAVMRGAIEYRTLDPVRADPLTTPAPPPVHDVPIRHDASGNFSNGPTGSLLWPNLLRGELQLGHVVNGEAHVQGDPQVRARLRGQVVARGPQNIGGQEFDVAVLEVYGDATRGDTNTRLEGALALDVRSGLLLRLDLRSAEAAFNLQRRLIGLERAPRGR